MNLHKDKSFLKVALVLISIYFGFISYAETSVNQYLNGRILEKAFSIIPKKTSTNAFEVTLIDKLDGIEGLAEGAKINGFCEKLVYRGKKKKNRKHLDHMMLTKSAFKIDPSKKYKIKMRVFLPERNLLSFSSYCSDSKRNQLKDKKKGYVWSFYLQAKGPMTDFEEFETTIGPKGSKAKFIFPENIDRLNGLKFRLYKRGNTFYIDDLVIEEVPSLDGVKIE